LTRNKQREGAFFLFLCEKLKEGVKKTQKFLALTFTPHKAENKRLETFSIKAKSFFKVK